MFSRISHASLYNSFRFSYPAEVFDTIIGFVQTKRPQPLTKAVDVACGTGLGTRPLAAHFDHVIGTDISEAQIREAIAATRGENVSFSVADCYNIPSEDNSCDLVSCAEAAHWFEDIDRFYAECDRVLKPNGCLVLYGYFNPILHHVTKQDELNQVTTEFYNHPKLALLRSPRIDLLAGGYRDLTMPYPESIRNDTCEYRSTVTLSALAGLMKSYSYYQDFVRLYPDDPDPVDEAVNKWIKILGTSRRPDEVELNVALTIFMLLGRKP